MPQPTIDVVVPVHGKWSITRSCLEHLARQSVAHRVVVVDDASPDDTRERLSAEFPDVDLVALDVNVGFAAACNAGMRDGDADIVVLVNNDVEAEPEMLERLVAVFTDPGIGSAGPLLLKPDGRVDALGICADSTMAGFVRFAGATVEAAVAASPTEGGRLLGPYGAVAAYRRSALTAVGLFDEGIGMYGEELDLALRLSAAGWATTIVPEARGTHLGGATSGRGSANQRRRAGFGRGYLLRTYGIGRSRWAVRAFVTEFIVCAGDAVLSRDLASTQGRVAGWRAGAHGATKPRPSQIAGVDRGIGFVRSLTLRIGDRAS